MTIAFATRDWLTLLAVVVSFIVGGGGALVGLRAQRQAVREAEKGRDHDRRMTHDRRLWEARSRLYEDLLTFVRTYTVIVAQTRPLIRFGEPELPEEDPVTERLRLAARLDVFGSESVRSLFEQWFKEVQDFFWQSSHIDVPEQQHGGARPKEAREPMEAMRAHRENVNSLSAAIAKAVREELTSPP